MSPQIVLFGPECSGKSTLAAALAEHYQGILVAEHLRTYAQDLWDTQKRTVTLEDSAALLDGQFDAQQQALALAQDKANYQYPRPVFMDTNIEQLEVYFKYYFGVNWGQIPQEMLPTMDQVIYLLTQPDIPWQADDLRDRPLERDTLFSIFKAYLDEKGVRYKVMSGPHEQRIKQACQFINKTWPKLHV